MTTHNASTSTLDQETLDRAVNGALEGLLYSQRHQNGANMDSCYSTCDSSEELRKRLSDDFKSFAEGNGSALAAMVSFDFHEIGILWVNARNGERDGFDNQNLGGVIGAHLDAAARAQGEVMIYGVSDDEFTAR